MPTTRRKRHRILALAAAGAVAVLVAVVVAAVVVWLRQPDTPPTALPPSSGAIPPTGVPPTSSKPRPESQDASCPDVQMLSIPGTWESSPQMDPLNPTLFPIALLLNVTNPIRGAFGADRVGEYTVPYTAQFHNPFSADKQMSYNDSRAEGTRAAVKAMTDMNNRCPLTSYVLVGFSQGAVIAGDMASDIDEVLHGERAAGERSCRSARQGEAAVRAEGACRVFEVRERRHSAARAALGIG